MGPGALFVLVWAAWAISWVIAAAWSRQVRKQVPVRDMLTYRVPIVVGAVLL